MTMTRKLTTKRRLALEEERCGLTEAAALLIIDSYEQSVEIALTGPWGLPVYIDISTWVRTLQQQPGCFRKALEQTNE